MPELVLLEGPRDADVAAWLHARLTAALARTAAPMAVTFPGGSTPFPTLSALLKRPVDWRRITVWPNDDRMVPEDHPASNTGRLRALLEPAGAEVVTLSEMEQVPHFALTWLGMGLDGHTASLFPSADPRADDPLPMRRIMPDPLPPEAPFARITLTIPALLDTDSLLVVLRGEGKAAVFERAMNGESDTPIARLLAAARVPVTCFA